MSSPLGLEGFGHSNRRQAEVERQYTAFEESSEIPFCWGTASRAQRRRDGRQFNSFLRVAESQDDDRLFHI